MWPGILMPRMTVPGNRRWPMAPERPMPALGAVRRVAAAKPVPLHDTFKAPALGHADGIHVIARRKNRRPRPVAGFHFQGEIAELPDAFDRLRR